MDLKQLPRHTKNPDKITLRENMKSNIVLTWVFYMARKSPLTVKYLTTDVEY